MQALGRSSRSAPPRRADRHYSPAATAVRSGWPDDSRRAPSSRPPALQPDVIDRWVINEALDQLPARGSPRWRA
ncbi:hypothetical protein ACPA9J_20750 [Pseudomonas aeruginosa]